MPQMLLNVNAKLVANRSDRSARYFPLITQQMWPGRFGKMQAAVWRSVIGRLAGCGGDSTRWWEISGSAPTFTSITRCKPWRHSLRTVIATTQHYLVKFSCGTTKMVDFYICLESTSGTSADRLWAGDQK